MDARVEAAGLSEQTREALARRIRARLSAAEHQKADHDVAIVGDGVSALALALELRRARPQTRILVIGPTDHPVPEITHTVGESTVEVSAHYLRHLGLTEHLTSRQIRKMGLRMFFSNGGNTDITRRLELGSSTYAPQVTYQIDRGRLENELARSAAAMGVRFAGGRVRSVQITGPDGLHVVTIQDAEAITRTTARWVVDASGRNRLLPRQLELQRPNAHQCNAAWFRVATEIDVGRWSDDPAWRQRLSEGDRAMSTNHLMGPGYWVWLIRLPSGATSVGIVADPDFEPFDGFNTLDKAKAWLRAHEPQLAEVLEEHTGAIMDFRVMKRYSHGASKVFDGRDRWCLTGDAGIFLDPLYSSGLDLVAIGNGQITDMVTRDLDGQDVVARAQISDAVFRSLGEMWLVVYQGQYALMGRPAVMSAKIIWDIAFYWGFIGLLYINGRFVGIADDPEFVPHLNGLIALSNRVQKFLQEWAEIDDGTPSVPFVDLYAPLNFMVSLHVSMMEPSRNFAEQFDANAALLRRLAGQLAETVIAEKSLEFDDDNVMATVQNWQQDPLLRELRSAYRRGQRDDPLSEGWIVTSSPKLQPT
ncbi:NAD(P)/FAD-dependent oxidoreductase [Mycolicibacter hiberniae]|uniref:Halogenase n=1 Tax=Mycolicibacter hiberniae TaxID=29314 RepID=A0A7I7WYH1_9MYCO|nr:tryptophan 7-halogenase [Mycolicibacter hiberniae]MCV7086787.1 tryptophan 7-halogenase [Mycolicibacter hiberniae]BBZ21915.1 halogenase [Mycolicibacter hiberniae]